jgi:hypothetical protein
VILVTDHHLLKLSGDVISGTTVSVPVRVDAIAGQRCTDSLHIGLVVFFEAMPAINGLMALLLADLARQLDDLSTSLVAWRGFTA